MHLDVDVGARGAGTCSWWTSLTLGSAGGEPHDLGAIGVGQLAVQQLVRTPRGTRRPHPTAAAPPPPAPRRRRGRPAPARPSAAIADQRHQVGGQVRERSGRGRPIPPPSAVRRSTRRLGARSGPGSGDSGDEHHAAICPAASGPQAAAESRMARDGLAGDKGGGGEHQARPCSSPANASGLAVPEPVLGVARNHRVADREERYPARPRGPGPESASEASRAVEPEASQAASLEHQSSPPVPRPKAALTLTGEAERSPGRR